MRPHYFIIAGDQMSATTKLTLDEITIENLVKYIDERVDVMSTSDLHFCDIKIGYNYSIIARLPTTSFDIVYCVLI